jgi:hypothetical protein
MLWNGRRLVIYMWDDGVGLVVGLCARVLVMMGMSDDWTRTYYCVSRVASLASYTAHIIS